MRILIFLFSYFLCIPQAFSAITFTNGKWETSFDCAEVTAITSDAVGVCGELDAGYYFQENSSDPSSITSTSNNPNGRGDKGFRHNLEGGDRNDASASVTAIFPSGQSEAWVRFYHRSKPGMSWGGIYHHKVLYYRTSSNGAWFYLNIPQWGDNNVDTMGINVNNGDEYSTLNYGWYTIQGGSTSADGNFDCIEVYTKINSASGVHDGIVRIWHNGVLGLENTAVDFLETGIGDGLIHEVQFGSNHDTVNGTGSQWEDFDDIAIAIPSFAGFIKDSHGNNMIGPLQLFRNRGSRLN